ncbi:aminoglycoside 6-adenylyltransferase [Portibacter marinus]|uniref:aminoglycoside 6-adenylyltransferase n=1 Tax=Portibacter marinus TaxID=2898660 RepID=UPI001F36C84A|nr:aminoglycoside 6-adenylyltransferase [Portibacter marinus]
MRSEKQIFALIKAVAQADQRIRAVILNGSRANNRITPDRFQDYDITFVVKDLDSFRAEPDWIDVFGQRIIMQMPNSMKLDEEDRSEEQNSMVYLMLFEDHNRIDLTLIPVDDMEEYSDSLTKVLLDKDAFFDSSIEATEKDYWVRRPTEKDFLDCCNEFWWVSTYVIKGLMRREVYYAKDMLEGPVRKMFSRMLKWYAGAKYDFEINVGKSNRFLKKYIDHDTYRKVLKTYPDAEVESIWSSIEVMMDLFNQLSAEIADRLGFSYLAEEGKNVKDYFEHQKKLSEQ